MSLIHSRFKRECTSVMLSLHTPCWTTDSGKRLRRRSSISAFSKVLKHCSVAFKSISHWTRPGSVSKSPEGKTQRHPNIVKNEVIFTVCMTCILIRQAYPLTSQKLCMFVLRVTAQGSCDDTDLSPNNRLIWKVYKPARRSPTVRQDQTGPLDINASDTDIVHFNSHVIQQSPR